MALGVHLPAWADGELQEKLGEVLAGHLAACDILGRHQILQHAHALTGRRFEMSERRAPVFFAEQDDSDQAQHDHGDLGISFDVGGPQTAAQIRGLTPVTKPLFDGLSAIYKRDAFTLAGAADVRLIEKIRDALAENAAKGETLQDFRKAVAALTDEAGVDEINAFTLDTAFQIAMQKAYSAGRLEQMRQPDIKAALPFWQYWTVGDDRVRPGHAQLDGFVARADDPIWLKIYPPWDFGCRCSVAPLGEREALKADKNAGDEGWARVRSKAFTMAEIETSRFGTLLAG